MTAGNVYLETSLGVGFETVTHFGSDSKAVCSVQRFCTLVMVCIDKHIPGIGRQVYESGQFFRLLPEDSEEIDDISVNVVHRLDS